jgi:RNA polymerase sigma factor (sigma-70 family)
MLATKQKTDAYLLRQFSESGNERYFAELVARYQQMVFATAKRMCGNDADAQDVAQQVLIVLARRAGELEQVKNLGAWLHKVAVLESKKSISKSMRTRKREESAFRRESSEQSGETLAEKLGPELDEALDDLKEEDRAVLNLHYLQGRSFKAIAEEHGGAAGTWQKRSVRALQKLAQQLQRKGVTVSSVTLLSVFTAGRAEAGLSSAVQKSIVELAAQTVSGSTTSGVASGFFAAKTGAAACLLAGAALSYTYLSVVQENVENPSHTNHVMEESAQPNRFLWDPVSSRSVSNSVEFSISLIQSAVGEYDLLEQVDRREESRLKNLMFTVPAEYLEEVSMILMGTHHSERFRGVAEALFARWAELEPVVAFQRAKELEQFKWFTRRGVILTWLEMDLEGAVQAMALKKENWDKGFLTDFLKHKAELDPERAAEVVDYVAEYWPETDTQNLRLVADYWSRTDAEAAGEWVASHHDVKVKEALLERLAGKVGRVSGFYGLGIADRIENPEKRAEARNKAIYWWGVSIGGYSLTEDKVRPHRDLSGGMPEDWTDENVHTFSMALMENFKQNYPDLLKLARSDSQRLVMLKGLLRGASHSDPSYLTEVVEMIPESYARTEQGKHELKAYIRNWYVKDAEAAEAWLSTQANSESTVAMWEELGRGQEQ